MSCPGADEEFIGDILKDVSKQHAAMGFEEKAFPYLGRSFVCALEQVLGTELRACQREAWEELFDIVSHQMRKELRKIYLTKGIRRESVYMEFQGPFC